MVQNPRGGQQKRAQSFSTPLVPLSIPAAVLCSLQPGADCTGWDFSQAWGVMSGVQVLQGSQG